MAKALEDPGAGCWVGHQPFVEDLLQVLNTEDSALDVLKQPAEFLLVHRTTSGNERVDERTLRGHRGHEHRRGWRDDGGRTLHEREVEGLVLDPAYPRPSVEGCPHVHFHGVGLVNDDDVVPSVEQVHDRGEGRIGRRLHAWSMGTKQQDDLGTKREVKRRMHINVFGVLKTINRGRAGDHLAFCGRTRTCIDLGAHRGPRRVRGAAHHAATVGQPRPQNGRGAVVDGEHGDVKSVGPRHEVMFGVALVGAHHHHHVRTPWQARAKGRAREAVRSVRRTDVLAVLIEPRGALVMVPVRGPLGTTPQEAAEVAPKPRRRFDVPGTRGGRRHHEPNLVPGLAEGLHDRVHMLPVVGHLPGVQQRTHAKRRALPLLGTRAVRTCRCTTGCFERSSAHRLKGGGPWSTSKVMRQLHVAVRYLDPPRGGAEHSLAALLNGLAHAGPVASEAPTFVPTVPIDLPPSFDAWRIRGVCSQVRGETSGLLDEAIDLTRVPLAHEGVWSRAAWGLRQRSGERRPRPWAHLQHLKRRNAQFKRVVTAWLPDGASGLGLTQLDYAPGAASAFKRAGLPWVVFVRDEIVFRFPELFREAIEGAALVCGAGEGLLEQVRSTFDLRATANVPLPIDFGGRFGSLEHVTQRVRTAREDRGDGARPRITVVGMSPEGGLVTYHALLPRLAERWPEAEVEFVGGGAYIEELRRYPNAVHRGTQPVEEVFPASDVHLLLRETTGSWGRVINEAGLHRVPTVSCSIGSQPEAVGPGGLVVDDHRDIDALIEALQHAHQNREHLGQRALEHAAVVDHRRSIACFREALEGLLGE